MVIIQNKALYNLTQAIMYKIKGNRMTIKLTSKSTSLCNAWYSVYEHGKLLAEVQWDFVKNAKIIAYFHRKVSADEEKEIFSLVNKGQ